MIYFSELVFDADGSLKDNFTDILGMEIYIHRCSKICIL